jgi:D-3-phosphoglycerate dehydrogenase
MRQGKWDKKVYDKGLEIWGKTLGIIGFGRIGQRLCGMARAMGMTVYAYDIYHIPGIEEKMDMKYVELDELFAKCDIISLHTPAVNGKPLINAENIEKMKDGVVIINTSRGNNVDEAALLDALNRNKVRAAGLDVFAEEPTNNLALISHPYVSCTPHIGASTVEAQRRIGTEVVEIINKF